MSVTIQTNAHKADNSDITKYSLMLGGLNVTRDALNQYDPLITGYGRLFMVRKPNLFNKILTDEFNKFKHILEYGNTGIGGLGDVDLASTQIKGGYVGREFDIPTLATDGTSGLNIKTFEFSGSPLREVLHFWINSISDLQSGFAHYGGLIQDGKLSYKQANHTAEFIYVVTDRTGMKVEYACQYCNCFPKGYKNDHFNYDAGQHEFVDTSIEFYGTKYESAEINAKAAILLQNYQILVNSLEFNSGLDDVVSTADGILTPSGYNQKNGKIESQGNINYRNADKAYDYDTYNKTTPSYTTKGRDV